MDMQKEMIETKANGCELLLDVCRYDRIPNKDLYGGSRKGYENLV
jgi:hypothetical protein